MQNIEEIEKLDRFLVVREREIYYDAGCRNRVILVDIDTVSGHFTFYANYSQYELMFKIFDLIDPAPYTFNVEVSRFFDMKECPITKPAFWTNNPIVPSLLIRTIDSIIEDTPSYVNITEQIDEHEFQNVVVLNHTFDEPRGNAEYVKKLFETNPRLYAVLYYGASYTATGEAYSPMGAVRYANRLTKKASC